MANDDSPGRDAEPPLFDPEAPEFADIPLVRIDGEVVTLVRGALPQWPAETDLLAEARQRTGEAPAGLFGVLLNDLDEFELALPGEPVSRDPRFSTWVDAKFYVRGDSLADVAWSLRHLVELLERANAPGWRLAWADDGQVNIERDRPGA